MRNSYKKSIIGFRRLNHFWLQTKARQIEIEEFDRLRQLNQRPFYQKVFSIFDKKSRLFYLFLMSAIYYYDTINKFLIWQKNKRQYFWNQYTTRWALFYNPSSQPLKLQFANKFNETLISQSSKFSLCDINKLSTLMYKIDKTLKNHGFSRELVIKSLNSQQMFENFGHEIIMPDFQDQIFDEIAHAKMKEQFILFSNFGYQFQQPKKKEFYQEEFKKQKDVYFDTIRNKYISRKNLLDDDNQKLFLQQSGYQSYLRQFTSSFSLSELIEILEKVYQQSLQFKNNNRSQFVQSFIDQVNYEVNQNAYESFLSEKIRKVEHPEEFKKIQKID